MPPQGSSSFPAIFLLAANPDYWLSDGYLMIWEKVKLSDWHSLALVASIFLGFLGVMYFIIFRRVWLVEDPLPLPGFEATLKMLDIASDVSTGAVEHARDSLKTIGVWTGITMIALFIIEYPLVYAKGKTQALTDYVAELLSGDTFGLASFYSHKNTQPGEVHRQSVAEVSTLQSRYLV